LAQMWQPIYPGKCRAELPGVSAGATRCASWGRRAGPKSNAAQRLPLDRHL